MSSWGLRRSVLVMGDVVCLLVAVPVALSIRAGELPTWYFLNLHITPFLIVALISIIVFFTAGLYDRATALMRQELLATIVGAQVINVALAAIMFVSVPVFGIAPKTNLMIYLAVSVILVSAWRIVLPLAARGFVPRTAIMIGDNPDMTELINECGRGKLCPLEVVGHVTDPGGSSVLEAALAKNPDFIVMDTEDRRFSPLFLIVISRASKEGAITDFTALYERVFRRIPLSVVSYRFLAYGTPERILFDGAKRVLDIVLSIPLFIMLVLLTPFVAFLIRLEGSGPIFIRQERIGRGYRPITVTKFRTMTESDQGTWKGETANRVTRVGALLRRTSIDELPQVLAVLAGSLSLIGPRSDVAALADRLSESIVFYRLRYQVTPGISGWAQVHQRYAPGNISPQSIEESRIRLAYDLYYVKHRSPILDISIALRTLKTLILRVLPHGPVRNSP